MKGSNSTVGNKDKIVGSEVAAEIIGTMQEESRLDLGHSFVVRGTHPTHGKIAVINSAEGNSAVIAM